MRIEPYMLEGVYVIDHDPHEDDRGFFMRTFDDKAFRDHKLPYYWVQENHAKTIRSGILRGLHFQLSPYSETKLVRCISGMILDVFVDLRKESLSYGKWSSIELNGDVFRSILIPRGFAHGYLTLSSNSEVLYKVDNYYNPHYERGIIWNDPYLAINWPITNPELSEKDKKNMLFAEYHNTYEM